MVVEVVIIPHQVAVAMKFWEYSIHSLHKLVHTAHNSVLNHSTQIRS